jgi:hypothetical protein
MLILPDWRMSMKWIFLGITGVTGSGLMRAAGWRAGRSQWGRQLIFNRYNSKIQSPGG